MSVVEPQELLSLEEIEQNLCVESSAESTDAGFQILSPSGLMVLSASGFMVF
jgi:hypothetical protein